MFNSTIIGLDIGRSAVKVVAVSSGNFHRLIFPSIVSPAIDISIKDAAERAAAETVSVGGRDYFTGETAALQGRVTSSPGLSDAWTDTTAYEVLVASAMTRLAHRGVPGLEAPYIVIGTPSKLFRTAKEHLAKRTLDAVPAETVRVLPQPMGAFSSFALDRGGAAIRDRHRDRHGNLLSWAVIEVGHFTTDFLLMRDGTYVEAMSDSCEGMHFAASQLARRLATKGLKLNDLQAEEVLRTRQVKHFGQLRDVSEDVAIAIDGIVQSILMKADTLLSSEVSTLEGVLLAGGGGPMIYEALKRKWPNTVMVEDPRMSVAEGFARFGVGAVAKRAMSVLAKTTQS